MLIEDVCVTLVCIVGSRNNGIAEGSRRNESEMLAKQGRPKLKMRSVLRPEGVRASKIQRKHTQDPCTRWMGAACTELKLMRLVWPIYCRVVQRMSRVQLLRFEVHESVRAGRIMGRRNIMVVMGSIDQDRSRSAIPSVYSLSEPLCQKGSPMTKKHSCSIFLRSLSTRVRNAAFRKNTR